MNNVIVLIPHYNNPVGLKKSLESVGKNEQVDILVVDDGSKDLFEESDIRASFKAQGVIHFIYLNKNQGIEFALNAGLDFAKNNNSYTYIARLDCDDFCVPDRFAKQANFLEDNPNVYLVGSYCTAISESGKFLFEIKLPTHHEQIRKKMYFNSMFIHPTVMFRTLAINEVGVYPTNFKAAEDYAYFFEFVKKFKTAIIPESLVKIQIDDVGISATKRKIQVESRIRIIKNNFYFGYYPVAGLFRSYFLLYTPRKVINIAKKLLKSA
jgi:glycosyltransferase involved in cell wall biosynthesis